MLQKKGQDLIYLTEKSCDSLSSGDINRISDKGLIFLRIPKEHWIDWISNYEEGNSEKGKSYYRKENSSATAEDVYNRLLCPNMLIWLAEAAGVEAVLLNQVLKIEIKQKEHLATICKKIRVILPWELIEANLFKTH